MQKLKISVINSMAEKEVSNAGYDFMIHLSRFQDNRGIVNGVYYKETCDDLSFSHQTFYDVKESLVEKGLIKVVKGSYTDWDIQIVGNDFSDPESYKEGYINTNHNIFYSKDFQSMKVGEKLLAMLFIRISMSGRGSYNIGLEKFYEKYMKLLRVTKRVLQNYMTTLKKFFSIGVKERQYWITPLSKVFRQPGSGRTEVENYNQHFGKTVCRREKVKFNDKTLKDTVDLLKQYRNILAEKAENMLHKAIRLSIEKANVNIKNPYKWERILQPKLVHKILKDELIPLCI